MLYTIPDYYHEFSCIAGECEDTCCAGWQIVADEAALKKYKKVTGSFRKRLRRSINWKEGTFKQDKNKRCTFLNDENLCDMYTALGEKSLCRTCKMYPRHIEEFEDVREMTLSVSCPEVARILLGKKEPVRFLTYESNKEEEYDDFDPFLYSKLVDARTVMIDILQDRSKKLDLRVGLVLAIAHDLQVRIKRDDIFSIDDVFEKYQTENAIRFVEAKLAGEEDYAFIMKMFQNQYMMERLRDDWEPHLLEAEQILYGESGCYTCDKKHPWTYTESREKTKAETDKKKYMKNRKEFHSWLKEQMPDYEIQCEQLLVYFISTYFCGAVYDGEAYVKVQMAVVSVLLIHELLMAQWLKNEKTLEMEDIVDTVYRYSRELEHSDPNLNLMEKLMRRDIVPWFKKMNNSCK